MRRILVLLAVAVAAASVWIVLRRGEQPAHAERHNVVLITIDTLRADRVGRGLTPAIDALGAAGARFENARAAVPLTLPSHVTMMTGMAPPEHGVRQNGAVFKSDRPTLARALRDAGYQTAAFVGAYVLDRRFGLADGFSTYDDRIPRHPDRAAQLEAERPGTTVADAALGWLASAREPFFVWLHFYDPHAPYTPPAEFLGKAGGNAYDGEVAYVDSQVARVLDALRARGAERRSVVAIAGDHGEGLGEHGEQTHGMLVYDSTLRVPLMVAGPRISPATIARAVSLVDLPQMLLRVAGVDRPRGMPGVFLLSTTKDVSESYAESEYPRTAGWHPVSALADDRWKLILSSEAELYDIRNDPGETRNVAPANPSVAEAMTKRVGDLVRPAPEGATTVSPEAAERLRALGYVSGAPGSRKIAQGAPNPAKVIASWNAFEESLSRLTSGRAREALPDLQALAARHPEALVFQSTYARALQEAGQPAAALAIYRDAVKRWPADAMLFHDLAVAARAAGDTSEAMRAEQAALALEPDNPVALNGLGLLHVDAGRPAEAAAAFERAANADPSNVSHWTNLGNARRELRDAVGADAAYRRALEVDSKYADALNGLGVLLVQQGKPAEAVSWFERALQHAPDLHEARLNLGIAYQESGQHARAADAYREVLRTAPTSANRERQAASELLKQLSR